MDNEEIRWFFSKERRRGRTVPEAEAWTKEIILNDLLRECAHLGMEGEPYLRLMGANAMLARVSYFRNAESLAEFVNSNPDRLEDFAYLVEELSKILCFISDRLSESELDEARFAVPGFAEDLRKVLALITKAAEMPYEILGTTSHGSRITQLHFNIFNGMALVAESFKQVYLLVFGRGRAEAFFERQKAQFAVLQEVIQEEASLDGAEASAILDENLGLRN